jgi:hypothetical protein
MPVDFPQWLTMDAATTNYFFSWLLQSRYGGKDLLQKNWLYVQFYHEVYNLNAYDL